MKSPLAKCAALGSRVGSGQVSARFTEEGLLLSLGWQDVPPMVEEHNNHLSLLQKTPVVLMREQNSVPKTLIIP